MPTYVFESPSGQRVELFYSVNDCPRTLSIDGQEFRKVLAPVAFYVPPWMRAPGAAGSSADSSDRQAAYLKSDAHRANMEQAERISEKAGKADARARKEVAERLA